MSDRQDVVGELLPPDRLMLTRGPSCVDPRVYRAMAAPTCGHMDPWFTGMMDDVQTLFAPGLSHPESHHLSDFRFGFRRDRSGCHEPAGDLAACPVVRERRVFRAHGHHRRAHTRQGDTRGSALRSAPVDPHTADVLRAGKGRKIRILGLTHGETSSGIVQRIEDYRKVADELGTVLVVDAVATFAGVPLDVERQRIDICFSGTQKALSAPPGMAPITVSTRVEEVMRARKEPVRSWYFDLTPAMSYWGKERLYHHTPPITLIYGLREALRAVLDEGLEARWERHHLNQQALIAGLEAMGLELFVSNPG